MAHHDHEHTHEVNNPNGQNAHGDISHSHLHSDGMNEHHHYTEEPPAVVLGPITPGQWMLRTTDQVDLTTGKYPAYIYVSRGDTEVVVALIGDAMYRDTTFEEPGQSAAGSWKGNAKALVNVPALLRFVQSMTVQGGINDVADIRDRALALIEQLNQVEVRSDTDRW